MQQVITDTLVPEFDHNDGISGGYGTIAFVNEEGFEITSPLRHLGRHDISFEMLCTDGILRTSEVVNQLRVKLGARTVYSGRATMTQVTPAGVRMVCRAALEEPGIDHQSVAEPFAEAPATTAFGQFIQQWEKNYRIAPAFKVVVADLQTLLADLEIWLSQMELGLGTGNGSGPPSLEHLDGNKREWLRTVSHRLLPALDALFERFESAANETGPEHRAVHRVFARRQLHPWLLSAPFLHRTYRKPLGYAGDYEMVRMITREPLEGATAFAQLINLWFLRQPPAQAHRNRLAYLEQRIGEVTTRAAGVGRTARILSVGCGPAVEVQNFVKSLASVHPAHFTLLDFNQETLERTQKSLDETMRYQRRLVDVDYIKKSVVAILRESSHGVSKLQGTYDFVYCAGLFDYLTDPICQRLSTQLFDWVRPGGLFLTTNVDASNPWPRVMDYLMDWHLIYRNASQMRSVRPDQVEDDDCAVTADDTGVNIYFEARKRE